MTLELNSLDLNTIQFSKQDGAKKDTIIISKNGRPLLLQLNDVFTYGLSSMHPFGDIHKRHIIGYGIVANIDTVQCEWQELIEHICAKIKELYQIAPIKGVNKLTYTSNRKETMLKSKVQTVNAGYFKFKTKFTDAMGIELVNPLPYVSKFGNANLVVKIHEASVAHDRLVIKLEVESCQFLYSVNQD